MSLPIPSIHRFGVVTRNRAFYNKPLIKKSQKKAGAMPGLCYYNDSAEKPVKLFFLS
jgi:hypothetical protein